MGIQCENIITSVREICPEGCLSGSNNNIYVIEVTINDKLRLVVKELVVKSAMCKNNKNEVLRNHVRQVEEKSVHS